MSKITVTPLIFKTVSKQYREVVAARREKIIQQFKQGKSQKWIADYWEVNISVVNRFVNKLEKGKNNV